MAAKSKVKKGVRHKKKRIQKKKRMIRNKNKR